MSPQANNALSLAKRLLVFILVGVVTVFLIRGIYALGPQSPESDDQKRKLKTRDFRDMPVALVEVRNLQSETWYDDLEIELKNVSTKPIYFLTAYLEFPDDRVGGTVYGIRLAWGNSKSLDSRRYAQPEAEYVEPGKTLILAIPERYKKGLNAMHRLRPYATKNLRLWFEKTYFGDGTGFESEGQWKTSEETALRISRIRNIIRSRPKKSGVIQLPPPQNQSVVEVIVLSGWYLMIQVLPHALDVTP